MPVRITLKPNGPIMISAEGDPTPVLHTASGDDFRKRLISDVLTCPGVT